MLFDKSPGNEKFVSLKCMLNAKAHGSIARTRGYLRPTKWPTQAASADPDCAFAKVRTRKCPSGWAQQRERLNGAGEYLDPADKQKKSQYGLWDGDALLSHRVAPAVPSARVGLTSGFGMGPGVPPQQESPAHKKHWLSWTSFALSAEDKKELCAHNREEASTIFRIMGASHVKHN